VTGILFSLCLGELLTPNNGILARPHPLVFLTYDCSSVRTNRRISSEGHSMLMPLPQMDETVTHSTVGVEHCSTLINQGCQNKGTAVLMPLHYYE